MNKILAALCVLFLGTTLFLLWYNFQKTPVNPPVEAVITDTTRSAGEIQLQETINKATTDTLLLSDSIFTQPVIISDTLTLHQDSLFILSKGNIVLKADSSYSGPAFNLSSDARFILMDGIRFENFQIAISAQNDALYLRNVLFINCKWPVQNYFTFPDNQYVTGRLAGSYFFRTDSLNTPSR